MMGRPSAGVYEGFVCPRQTFKCTHMTKIPILKTTVLLADMADFAAMNEVYSQFFGAPYPARSAVAVKALPKGALVEIECIAAQ